MRLVSIVIPVFNRETLIKQTIENLLLQTYPHFEIVVVDDASTDSTYPVIQSLGEKDRRIRWFQNNINGGAQVARNLGIKESQGEWIAFQDSDDLWNPKKLERQMAELQKVDFDPMTVVHTDCVVYYHGKKKKVIWELPETQGNGVFKQLLSRSTVLFPAILTSKKALEAIGCLDEKVPSYQEWDTAIRLAQRCKFIHIREPLFIYNIHPGFTISKDGEKADAGYRYVIDKFRKEILENCGEHAWNNHLRNLWSNALSAGLWEKSDSYLEQLALNEVEIVDTYLEKIYYFLQNNLWHNADYLLKRMSHKKYIHQARRKELRILRFLAKYHINPHYFLAVGRRLKYFFSKSFNSIANKN
ncbi:MAG: glycosyltransferase [Acidobacteria bacterium]|jgi:glycosyltransferase involved in cell wall biosynthesis|nr:glycosyltransferase [Acidobacteriota bacterium]